LKLTKDRWVVAITETTEFKLSMTPAAAVDDDFDRDVSRAAVLTGNVRFSDGLDENHWFTLWLS
jgi:hypothetical protein